MTVLIKKLFNKTKEVIMKIFNFILLALTVVLSACSSKDDEGGGLNPFAPNNTASSVTINVSHLESTQYTDVIEFYFKPSTGITITKVDVAVQTFTDVLQGDSQTVYEKDQWSMLVGYQGVEVGQEWTFIFHGKDAAANKDFQVTTKYVVNN